MFRARPPKKKKDIQPKISTKFILDVLMPCIMLACKDEFKIKDSEKLEKLNIRARRYIKHIADGNISIEELHSLMKCRDTDRC